MLPKKNIASFRAARWALIGALGCAAAAPSCATEGPQGLAPGGPEGPVAATADPTADDDAFGERHHPSIDFEPCADYPDAECGRLEVPADYDRPNGETLSLAAIRLPATGDRIGSLFANFGGPSGFQVDTLAFAADTTLAPLREHFDLVTFDPRGTTSSTPEIACNFEPPPEPPPGDPAARAAYLDEYARRFAEACQAQTGPLATQVGTNNVARDIELFRAALHEKTLSYWGISYGTELGAVYASLFPKRVRAMVLDGGVPDTFVDYTMQAYAEEAAGAELALRRLDQLCQNDPACPTHDIGLINGLDQVLAALKANPVPSPDGSFFLGDAEAGTVVYIFLIGERTRWGRLPGIVAAALEGNYDPWFNFAFPSDVGSDPFAQAYSAILCTDFGSRRPAANFLPLLESVEATYPRGKYAEFEVLLRTCQSWPEADPAIVRNVAGKVKTPILLVGNDFDPATPINWTRHLAHALGMDASFLHYLGGGHTVTFSSRSVPCVDNAAFHYLVDLEVPPEGTECAASPITFLPTPTKGSAAAEPRPMLRSRRGPMRGPGSLE